MLSFPLESITDEQLQTLGQYLWSWRQCDKCSQSRGFSAHDCSNQRSKQLQCYFDFYKDFTAPYESDNTPGSHPAITTHEDLFTIISLLKQHADSSRYEIQKIIFSSRPGRSAPTEKDQERAIDLAARVLTMMTCSSQRYSLSTLERGGIQQPWKQEVSFSKFLSDAIPWSDDSSLSEDSGGPFDMKPSLRAKTLKKRAGLTFVATDDLRCHLKLNPRKGVVHVFHHTAFLKEHLRLTRDVVGELTVSESLKLGALPRPLVLETLDTLQTVLFPLNDPKSRALLQSLVRTSGFDADMLHFENASIRLPSEAPAMTKYNYFGSRLADLYEEVENPTPRGWTQQWLERKSGARYVMMATLAGVIFAILLGMASLGVSIYQSWVAYEAWQHPVAAPSG